MRGKLFTGSSPLVLAAVADSTDFDIDAYLIKLQLAQENEDGG